jgi:cell division protein FtsL
MEPSAPIMPPRGAHFPSTARVWVPALAFLLLGVMGAALGHVWVRLQQIQTGYSLSKERRQARELAENQKRLRLEAAVLKQPQRIERIARVRLGMTAPDPAKIHVVRVPRTAERPPAPVRATALAHAAPPEARP